MSDELSQAAFDGDLEAVRRLLDGGADINSEGQTWNALHYAIESEKLACVQLLIRRGADIERCAGGLSPLAHAVDIAVDGTVQSGGTLGDEPTEVISLLLAAGADPASALDVARRYGSTKIEALLTAAPPRGR